MKHLIKNNSTKVSLSILYILGLASPVFAYAPEKGVSAAELIRDLGIFAIVLALVGLVVVEFFLKKKITRGTYKWLLFLGLFMLPIIAMISATTTLMHETTTVASCASCHNMHPFVNDMYNEESATLAARHYKNKWIETNQCYQCHTTYGIHGTLESKRDGFRHWLLYVTDSWKDPITFKGSYPNENCLACHGDTKKFITVDSHIALKDKLQGDEVSCASCHGPVHPTPLEREPTQRRSASVWTDEEVENHQAISAYIEEITKGN